ncbi:hypothetical protein C1J05_08980 [Sulfitobacter sp. JL08]|nr:hypothetical protein C1J05_08980 [Sulfitobacter sp. JL08]
MGGRKGGNVHRCIHGSDVLLIGQIGWQKRPQGQRSCPLNNSRSAKIKHPWYRHMKAVLQVIESKGAQFGWALGKLGSYPSMGRFARTGPGGTAHGRTKDWA